MSKGQTINDLEGRSGKIATKKIMSFNHNCPIPFFWFATTSHVSGTRLGLVWSGLGWVGVGSGLDGGWVRVGSSLVGSGRMRSSLESGFGLVG